MEFTRQLAEFVAEKDFDDISPDIIQQTKLLILDTLGCALGGYTLASEEVEWIVKFIKQQGCQGPSTIFADGCKTSSAYAALANGAMVHTVDFDDTHMGSVAHLNASLLATTFAMGEERGASGKEVIVSFILGFDLGARVGRSVMPSHYKFWHPTATFGGVAAAGAAAKMLHLNADQTEYVIGHAADAAGGLRYGVEKGDFSKTMHPAFSAMKAIVSAGVVSLGADGPVGLLEYPSGFCNAYSEAPVLEPLVSELGKKYEIMEDSIKSFPTIQCSHTAIQTTIDLISENKLQKDDIAEVNILHTETVKGQGCNYSPDTALAARLSIPFCIALAMCDGKVTLDQFTESRLHDPEILDCMNKVKIEASAEFKTKYPETIAAFVDIKAADGAVYSGSQIYPKGDPRNRMSVEEVKDKFRSLALNTFDSDQVEKIIDSILELEKVEDVSTVTGLFVKG